MPYHGFINEHTACGPCAKIVRKFEEGVFSWENQQWMRLQGLDCVINLHTQRVLWLQYEFCAQRLPDDLLDAVYGDRQLPDGILLLIVQIWDAINDPIIGEW